MKRLEAVVSGLVQGVGYRYFCKKTALAFGLHGYAKNLRNGNVEVIAEGDEDTLVKFIKALKQGPAHSRVEDVKYEMKEARNEFNDFYTY